MAAEAGHAPGRCYQDQDGNFHLNGAKFFDNDEVDVSAGINVVDLTASAAELNTLDGFTGDVDDLNAIAAGTKVHGIPLSDFRKDGAWKDPVDDSPGSSLLGLADTTGSPLLGNAASGNTKNDKAKVTLAL